MDVAAAPSLTAPAVRAGDADFPAIGDYALIGNCRTAALVSRGGAIEWLCVPVFSSPSVFGAILDREGGHFTLRPVTESASSRRYVDGTNALETTFRTPSGELRLTDCMTLPLAPDELHPQHEVLRRVECVAGEVE